MVTKERAEEFLAKLGALLREYEASIEADCGEGSDMHGICGEKMTINVGRWNQRGRVVVKVCDGWEFTANDLERVVSHD